MMNTKVHRYNNLLIVVFLLSLPVVPIKASSDSLSQDSCFLKWHIDNEAFVMDLSSYPRGCSMQFTTSDNQLLAFRYIEGNISDLSHIIKIRDGIEPQATLIELEKELSSNKLNLNQPKVVYTTGSTAVLEIIGNVQNRGHLKIQKAVSCPFNLGSSSQCGRVVDDVSCYCALYTKRTWQDQSTFCQEKGFQLLSIESPEEENAIYAAWGKVTYFWTSLTDAARQNAFVWSGTGVRLNPGYVNWHAKQPDGYATCDTPDHNCVHLNYLNGGWNDESCAIILEAICESQPV